MVAVRFLLFNSYIVTYEKNYMTAELIRRLHKNLTCRLHIQRILIYIQYFQHPIGGLYVFSNQIPYDSYCIVTSNLNTVVERGAMSTMQYSVQYSTVSVQYTLLYSTRSHALSRDDNTRILLRVTEIHCCIVHLYSS